MSTALDQLISSDVITNVGSYCGVFVGSGLLLGAAAWAVGYVVNFIKDVVKGGF